jgi:hypothetical protein
MTEKIAALAFVVVFALLFSIVVLGLLTAYSDRGSGLSAGRRATKRAMPTCSATFSRFARLTSPFAGQLDRGDGYYHALSKRIQQEAMRANCVRRARL